MMIMINKTMIYLFRCSLVSCAVFKLFELQKYPHKKVLNNNVSSIYCLRRKLYKYEVVRIMYVWKLFIEKKCRLIFTLTHIKFFQFVRLIKRNVI